MNSWILLSLITVIFWGLWGLLLKMASNILRSWAITYIFSYLVAIILAILLILYIKPHNIPINMGSLIAIAGGVLGTIGYISFLKALEKGPVILVVPITALYPAITAISAYIILKEQITFQHIIGVSLAIIAIILLTIQR